MAETQTVSTSLQLTVRNFDSIVFQGSVRAISSFNDKGPFDILPMHANFISIIKKHLTIHPTSGEKKEIPIEVGVLRAFENDVTIFLGIDLNT